MVSMDLIPNLLGRRESEIHSARMVVSNWTPRRTMSEIIFEAPFNLRGWLLQKIVRSH